MSSSNDDLHERLASLTAENARLRKTRDELQANNDRLSVAVEGTQDGLWNWNIQTNELWLAPRYYQLLDYEPDQIDSYQAWQELLHPEDRESTLMALDQHLQDSSSPFDIQYRLETRLRGFRWFHVRAAVVPDERGRPLVMSGSIRDIDDLKQAQAHLEQHSRELLAKNQELEQFTYIASHDLQEPLRKLVTFSGLLREDLPGDLPEDAAKDLRYIIEASHRMQQLVQDLLSLSRTGDRNLELTELAPAECIDTALFALETAIEESRARIIVGDLPLVQSDHTLLSQVFQNLIGNAVKFRGDTRPTINISAELSQQADKATFVIADNGIGFPQDYAEKIFAPFRRLHARDQYPGSGIGLAICKKAVERLGGKISAAGTPGDGARFRFTLPLRRTNTCQPIDAPQSSFSSKTTKRTKN